MKKSRLKRWQVVTWIAGSVIVMGFFDGNFGEKSSGE